MGDIYKFKVTESDSIFSDLKSDSKKDEMHQKNSTQLKKELLNKCIPVAHAEHLKLCIFRMKYVKIDVRVLLVALGMGCVRVNHLAPGFQ